MEDAEESTRMVEAVSRARKELTQKKAREAFEKEHVQKREDLQSRLDEAARQMWDVRGFEFEAFTVFRSATQSLVK